MDAQRASVHFVDTLEEAGALESATLVLQANGFAFTTAQNAALRDRSAEIVSPYSLTVDGSKDTPLRRRSAQLFYEDQLIFEFDVLRLCEIMSAPSLWYFERKDSDGNPLPEKVFVNPVVNCAFRCKPCSRLSFLNGHRGYLENIERMMAEISAQVPNRDELQVVNVSTGSLPTAKEDFEVFKAIIESFRRKEFHRARFSIATSSLFDDSQLRQLKGLGVERLSVTMDGTSDDVLAKLYHGKGRGTVTGYSEMIKRVEGLFSLVARSEE